MAVKTITIDNTAPTGALTQPAAAATVGGPSVALAASSSDVGTGVASVSYQFRPTGPGSFCHAVVEIASQWSLAVPPMPLALLAGVALAAAAWLQPFSPAWGHDSQSLRPACEPARAR